MKLQNLKVEETVRETTFDLTYFDKDKRKEVTEPCTLQFYSPTFAGFLARQQQERELVRLPENVRDVTLTEYYAKALAHYVVGIPTIKDLKEEDLNEVFNYFEFPVLNQMYRGLMSAIDPKFRAVTLKNISEQKDDTANSTEKS